MMFLRLLWFHAVVAVLLVVGGCTSDDPPRHQSGSTPAVAAARTPVYAFDVVNAWPHDTGAFTQGLLFHDGNFYESTGLEGRSSLRRVEVETGHVLHQINNAPDVFAEGLALLNDRLYQISWKNHLGFVYDLHTFKKIREFSFYNEGWGLTSDGTVLYMSDGTNVLRVLDPDTLSVMRTIPVFDGETPVSELNELEWVRGEIWANIWKSDRIVRINPSTGAVTGYVDLQNILDPMDRRPGVDVLNGIAWDSTTDRIWVTGKLWPRLFEIRIHPAADQAAAIH